MSQMKAALFSKALCVVWELTDRPLGRETEWNLTITFLVRFAILLVFLKKRYFHFRSFKTMIAKRVNTDFWMTFQSFRRA